VSEVRTDQQEQPAGDGRGEPLVKLEGVRKWFPLTRGILSQKTVGHVHAGALGVDLQLLDGGGPLQVAGDEHGVAALALQQLGQLARGRGVGRPRV
jgi:hypothetical protein